jgi:hypothetical protein
MEQKKINWLYIGIFLTLDLEKEILLTFITRVLR